MPGKIDLTGQRFGRLVVLGLSGKRQGALVWDCACDCGNRVSVITASLRRGRTRSCGCLNRELSAARLVSHNTKHGDAYSRLHRIWSGMKARCSNQNHPAYPDYGGRGISVCDEWRDDYSAFMEWAWANGYRDDLSIDRVDVNGNYEPGNCRWADRKTQANNTRRNSWISFDGETHTISQWAEIKGIPKVTLWLRLNRYHWPVERAITTGGKMNDRKDVS